MRRCQQCNEPLRPTDRSNRHFPSCPSRLSRNVEEDSLPTVIGILDSLPSSDSSPDPSPTYDSSSTDSSGGDFSSGGGESGGGGASGDW